MASRAGRRVHGRPRKFLAGLVDELIEYAEHEFRLDRRLDDGATERDHAESAKRQFAAFGLKPKQPVEVEGPEFPDTLDYLWAWFSEISLGIAANGMAPAQITWRDVEAWIGLSGNILEPWEARCVVQLGMLRASILSEASANKQNADGKGSRIGPKRK